MTTTRHLPSQNLYLDQLRDTPLVPVALEPGDPVIHCKLEFLNPSGSTKDRIASFILTKAWREGAIDSGSVVIEASSGSTSIAMALVCAQLGVRFIAVMPEGVSNERVLMITAYGGEVRLSPRDQGILGTIQMSQRIAADTPGSFLPRQFENPDNAAAHRFVTAREIICQAPHECVDAVVSGVGTGGTLVGLYHGFRDHGCQVKPFAAIPVARTASETAGPTLSTCFTSPECCSFSCKIPGVVDNISKLYKPDELDGIVELEVDEVQAIEATRKLIAAGFPVGSSSGLNYVAARQAAEQLDPGATIVTVFADRMERYFSTELFKERQTE